MPGDVKAREVTHDEVGRGDVFDVQTYAIHDGPGIRTAVYLRGCPLRCAWCHNPESWAAPTGGAGSGASTWISPRELVDRVLADRPFFEDSGGGVTFTGGEPTTQPAFLLEALDLLREAGIHTALETCGELRSSLCEPLSERVDLFLFDVKHADPDAHKAGTGARNERIVANLEQLVALVGPGRVIPRIPIISDFNSSPTEVNDMLSLLEKLGYSGEVHLMAYHDWARHKYEELGLRFCEMGPPLDQHARQAIEEQFDGRDLQPVWGGGS